MCLYIGLSSNPPSIQHSFKRFCFYPTIWSSVGYICGFFFSLIFCFCLRTLSIKCSKSIEHWNDMMRKYLQGEKRGMKRLYYYYYYFSIFHWCWDGIFDRCRTKNCSLILQYENVIKWRKYVNILRHLVSATISEHFSVDLYILINLFIFWFGFA